MNQNLAELIIAETTPLREVMACIDRNDRGIALVTDEQGHLLGTVTDGDMRRALLRGATLSDPVQNYMQRIFTSVQNDIPRSDVLDLMRARSLTQIPILDQHGRLAGLHMMREIVGAVERTNWAVIMAGGRGERLRPLTDDIPKPMVKVAGRPILERIVLHLVGFGVRRIFLSVYYKAEVIEKHFGNGSAFGCRIEYLREEKPLSTGGSLSLMPEVPAHPLVVLNGDLVTQFDLGSMLAFHAAGNYAATIGVHQYSHSVPYAVVDARNGCVAGVSEKPTFSWLTNAGIYVFDPGLLDRIPYNVAYPITNLIDDCLENGKPVGAYSIESDWRDVGRHQELQQARGEEQHR
jgi:dTDP-glucose pyrophosphorylase